MSLRSISLFLLQEKTEQACQFCDRVSTRRTVKNLESEIIQKTRRIQTEEKKYVHFFLAHVIYFRDGRTDLLDFAWSALSSVSLFWNSKHLIF